MRKPIIAGNWKMNKTLSEAVSFRGRSQIPALQLLMQFALQLYS